MLIYLSKPIFYVTTISIPFSIVRKIYLKGDTELFYNLVKLYSIPFFIVKIYLLISNVKKNMIINIIWFNFISYFLSCRCKKNMLIYLSNPIFYVTTISCARYRWCFFCISLLTLWNSFPALLRCIYMHWLGGCRKKWRPSCDIRSCYEE